MAVLERAARDHARRREPWLRLQTILFALAEQARTEPEVRAGIAPLWQAIEAVHATFFAERTASLVAPEPAAPAPFEALNISPRVLNGLETARELAYRLYTVCERKKRAAEALSYNSLVQSWPEMARLSQERPSSGVVQGNLFGEE